TDDGSAMRRGQLADDIAERSDGVIDLVFGVVEMRRDADTRTRPIVDDHIPFDQLVGDAAAAWRVEDHRAAALVIVERRIEAVAGRLRRLDQLASQAKRMLTN